MQEHIFCRYYPDGSDYPASATIPDCQWKLCADCGGTADIIRFASTGFICHLRNHHWQNNYSPDMAYPPGKLFGDHWHCWAVEDADDLRYCAPTICFPSYHGRGGWLLQCGVDVISSQRHRET